MKKGLIGISNNIKLNKEKIKLWAKTFKTVSDGEVILLAINADSEDITICNELGIQHVQVYIKPEDLGYINNKRLYHTVEFLKTSDIDIFMVTDVFDVVFQGDPFSKFDLDNYDVFLGGEGILLSEEPWNSDVINKCFPDYLEMCIHNEIICSGVMGGKRESLISMLNTMDQMCENAETGHDIRDQAALIIMVAKNEIPRLKILTIDDGWAMHCATSGPTPFFDSWGMRHNLSQRYSVPKLAGDEIQTEDGRTYDIVHQFNRVPEWHKILINKYIVE